MSTVNGEKIQKEVFDIIYKGKNINEILSLTVLEATEFFEDNPSICRALDFLKEIGLEYLRIGQSMRTFKWR